MKKAVLFFIGLASFQLAHSQSEQEHSYVAAEFKGILNLTITSNPQIDFDFKTMEDFQNGIVKYNAVTLEVDATQDWDLFAYATTDYWTLVESYSFDGETTLPAEALELQSSNPNRCSPQGGNFNSFTSLKGLTNSRVNGGLPDEESTQFIAGMVGKESGQKYSPGSAKANPETNQFKIHYRIVPGIPAAFPKSTQAVPGKGYIQKGRYSIEVIYALVEDL